MAVNYIRKIISLYIPLTWEVTKLSILSAMEYRLSFIIQVMGMVVNDIGFVLLWLIFFKRFPSIQGWQFQDSIILLSIGTLSFSFAMITARGAIDLGKLIARGELDYYLSFPKNVLWHSVVSKTEISAIGDLFFGIIIYFFSANPSFSGLLYVLLISAMVGIILISFIILTESISFYVGSFEEAAEQMWHSLLGFSFYPQVAFHGVLKAITLTVLPAFFIAALPVRLIKDFQPGYFLLLLAFCAGITALAIAVFHNGLKKYESGNLINVKI